MTIELRKAIEEDFDWVRQAQFNAYREWSLAQFGPTDAKVSRQFFEDSWSKHSFQIISVEGDACGFCALEDQGDCIWVREFGIVPKRQSEGIGTEFLCYLVSRLPKTSSIRLNTFKANIAGIRFYKRFGFSEVGETDTQINLEWTHPDS
ncbi:MAG: GNAT family N-acetyltransferase [Verrucomicrobiota bacterium]